MLIAVLVCKHINIVSCHKFIKAFQISRAVNSGACDIGALHRLAAHQENQDFLVCVLSVLVLPCELSCCGAKVKKRVSSFTVICRSALQVFEKALHIFTIISLCLVKQSYSMQFPLLSCHLFNSFCCLSQILCNS